MLIDDDKRFVELMIDNLMWGNVTIDWNTILKERTPEMKDNDTLGSLIVNYKKYKKSNDKNLEDVIPILANHFWIERLFGCIKGELRDREEEAKIRELTSHNQQLAENLSQAYIPPKDSKVGTT
jgi:hypothetical protein